MNIRRIAAAAGFATGAALAFAPLASADTSSNDWLAAIDGVLSGASPAASTTDFQISFNGVDLFPTTDNLAQAYTTAGQYGLAIASGDGAYASAEGGTGNFALASGTDANAEAGSLAGGATGNNDDTAVDIGNNGTGYLQDELGAYAGNGSLQYLGTDVGTDSNDSAYDIGNNSASGIYEGAFAGYDGAGGGNGDTAFDAGNNSNLEDGAFASDGNNNYASDSGNNTSGEDYAYASYGDNNTAIADTSDSISYKDVASYGGNGNYAYVYGPDNSTATADGGNDVAYVSDPFSGTTGAPDSAVAGAGFTNDLAEVLFAHGNASADTANLLYDIVSLFGNSVGSL